MKSLEAKVKKGFSLTDGPFVKGLDNSLKTFNVHRQQYYGGIFVGNHIHKTLQVPVCVHEGYAHFKQYHYLNTAIKFGKTLLFGHRSSTK